MPITPMGEYRNRTPKEAVKETMMYVRTFPGVNSAGLAYLMHVCDAGRSGSMRRLRKMEKKGLVFGVRVGKSSVYRWYPASHSFTVWLAEVDEVFGDKLVALGNSRAEALGALYAKYRRMSARHNADGEVYKKTIEDFYEYYGPWCRKLKTGSAYFSDASEEE